MKRVKFVCVAALVLATTPVPAPGQSADAVLRRVAAQARARAAGVENYTVEMSGFESIVTLYVVRRSPSLPYFQVLFAGSGRMGNTKTDLGWAEVFELMLQDIQERARRDPRRFQAGMAEIAGVPVHVVTFTAPRSSGPGPQRLSAYYDTTTLLVRRVEWAERHEDGAEIQIAVEYDDYRPVQGMQIAFRRRLVTRGVRAGQSAAELARMRSNIDQLRAELPRQPQAEQARSLQMIEALEGVLDHDELIWEMTVTSALINQGPPAGVQLTPLGR
jgi:hypothetical protein